jgi:spermidine synthase
MAAPASPGRTFRSAVAPCVTAACSGAALLALELIAAGWLAPVFGGGIDVWAAVLGATLGSMALGYFAGSLTTASLAGPRSLPWVFVAAGACALLCAAILRGITPTPEMVSTAWLLGMALLLLGPSMFLLAAASPWMVEILSAQTGAGAGRAAGLVYATSTLGGVAGALLTGLWAVPQLGLWSATIGSLVLLSLAAACCLVLPGRRRWSIVLAVFALGFLVLLGGLFRGGSAQPSVEMGGGGRSLIHREEGWYGRIEVYEDVASRYLTVNGIPQSICRRPCGKALAPAEMLASGNAVGLLPFVRPDAQRVLVIGLGAGVTSNWLAAGGLEVESVEIDPGVERVARRFFDFKGRCHVEDGRRFLLRCVKQYDCIYLDVYRGENLPAHLCTREFFALTRSRLAAEGILAVNLIGKTDSPDVGALLRTVRGIFPNVALFAPDGGRAIGPMTLLASRGVLLPPSTRDRLMARGLAMPARVDLGNFNPQAHALLTDELNPIRRLRRATALAWRSAALRADQEFRR